MGLADGLLIASSCCALFCSNIMLFFLGNWRHLLLIMIDQQLIISLTVVDGNFEIEIWLKFDLASVLTARADTSLSSGFDSDVSKL